MAALTLRISEPAADDLQAIAAYGTENWGWEKSNRYLDDLSSLIGNLLDNPYLGRTRDDLGSGVRGIRMHQHVIFYRIFRNQLEIVRVLHERQDVQIFSVRYPESRSLTP